MRSIAEIKESLDAAWSGADVDSLITASQEAAELSTQAGDYWSMRALMIRAFINEDYEETVALGQKCLDLAELAELRIEVAAVTGTIALVHTVTGNYVQALDLFHTSLAINKELENVRGIGLDTSNIGLTYSNLGELEKALEHMGSAMILFRSNDFNVLIGRTSSMLAEVFRKLGRFDEAIEVASEGLEIFRSKKSETGVAYNSMILARVFLDADRLEECKQVLDELAANPTTYSDALFETDLVRANYFRKIGSLVESEELFLSCLERARVSLRQARAVDIYAGLRDIAEAQSDLKKYIRFNNAYLKALEMLTGRETTQRIALQEADRRIADERVEREKERIERERERSVLFSTLPKDIAERVVKGETVTDQYDIATVIFMDIVNFTAKSSGLQAKELVDVLEGVFEDCDMICAKHDLLKIKTIGDSYMAVAFNEQSMEACVVRSVNTAFHILRIKRNWPDGTPIEFRIGLNTGPVVAGIIGRSRIQYDVWGDTVNTASRMESTGEAGRLQVNHEFAENLNPDLTGEEPLGTTMNIGPGWILESRGVRDVKGKGAMSTYWLSHKDKNYPH